jgi:mRNA interferase MazF
MKRAEIYWVDLGETVGSEQRGCRPCLIIQANVGNANSPTVSIVPITKASKNFTLTHATVDCLREPSIALCEQIRTVDKKRVKGYIATLSHIRMLEVSEVMRLTFGL